MLKKVTFSTEPPTIHNMFVWHYAYSKARKGKWEIFARDRARFKRRVAQISKIIRPVLDHVHRQFVYTERFAGIYKRNEFI